MYEKEVNVFHLGVALDADDRFPEPLLDGIHRFEDVQVLLPERAAMVARTISG